MAGKEGGRQIWPDLLRAAATLAVIVLHLAGSRMEGAAGSDWMVFNVYNGLARWCVPVFVMLSGMFMLDPGRPLPLTKLLFHHILRIVTALLFWGTVYHLVLLLEAGGAITLAAIWNAFYSVLLGDTHYHLWFLPMIVGLYLLTPLLRAFVRGADKGTLAWFFLVWGAVCLVFPLFQAFHESATAEHWLWAMYYSTATVKYVGFYVMGYSLRRYTLNRAAELLIYLLGVLGAVVTVGGAALLRSRGMDGAFLYEYCTPNVALTALAVGVVFRYVVGVSEERCRRTRVAGVARISFGIYLVHDIFLILLDHFGITTLNFLHPALAVPVLAAGVFVCAWAVAWVLSKIPLVGRYIT